MREIPETGLRHQCYEHDDARGEEKVRMREIPETGLRRLQRPARQPVLGYEGQNEGDTGNGIETIWSRVLGEPCMPVRMREIPETGLRPLA